MQYLTNKIGNRLDITRAPGKPLTVATMTTNPPAEYADILKVRAEFGLHYIRGNHAPYFSLTGTGWHDGSGSDGSVGGQIHELIIDQLPELADLAALHLSDIDGVPMHAESNGWYWLAGAHGGLGEKHHGGNGTYGKSADECLRILAEHLRIDDDEVANLSAAAVAAQIAGKVAEYKAAWPTYIAAQRGRWKREAEAAIAKYDLPVYGDAWERAA